MPDSYTAWSARGLYWEKIGWERRGTKFAGETSEEQFAAMRAAFERAAPDLIKAIELGPNHFPTYDGLISLLSAMSHSKEAAALFLRAMAIEPRSQEMRRAYMNFLKPRWGGSYAQMEQLAQDAQQYAAEYPLHRRLLGFAPAERATVARNGGRPPDGSARVHESPRVLPRGARAAFRSPLRSPPGGGRPEADRPPGRS